MRDLYRTITDRIIAELEQGVQPWHKPWNAAHVAGPITRPLRATGEAYNGINVVMLWLTAMERGYAAPIWMTFRQAKALGGHVRKGETGTLVVYAGRINRIETDQDTGEEQEREIPFLKGYTVFSVEQIDGLPAHYYAMHEPRLNPAERIAHAEAFFCATGADVRYGGNQPCYNPAQDIVRMPPFESYDCISQLPTKRGIRAR